MRRLVFLLSCTMIAAGCNSNDCVVTSVGSCQTDSGTPSTPSGGGTGGTGGSTAPTGPGVADFGALPNGAHISLDCRPYNVPGYSIHDCLYSHWHGTYDHTERHEPVDCTMKLADRNGLVVGNATKVSFASEAGAVSPVATSPEFDATKAVSDQKDLGHAVGYLEVFGAPLPPDVAPLPGEQSRVVDFGCGMRTTNPRDGFVTVIAYVRGEEGFVDQNGNGKYDAGEFFVDLGEPYVDANDNGKWDPGEWYRDTNGDGAYSGPNGVWDADTIIWTQTRVIYSGNPRFSLENGTYPFSRFYVTGSPPATTAVPPPFVVYIGPPATSVSYGVFLTDANLNPMSPLATFGVATASGNVEATLSEVDNTADIPGVSSFRLLYCDAPENPTQCFAGPADTACRTAPCYVVPEVGLCRTASCSGLHYGNFATVGIKAKTVGTDTVYVTTTLDGVITGAPAISGEVRAGAAP